MIKHFGVVVVVALSVTAAVHGSERRDISPGEANWHKYRIHVISGTGQVAVRQHVTLLWDNPGTGMLLALYNTENPANPRLQAISAGNDRLAALDVGLLPGTYTLVIGAVVAGTHYHLNSTYGRDELLFQQPNGPLRMSATELFMDRLIEEDLAPHLARLAAAMR